MPARTFYTTQISMPEEVRFADCQPTVYTTNFQLARAYLVQNYLPRSAWKRFDKGPFPPPILLQSNLAGNTASYTVYFNEFAGGQCPTLNCNLQCTNQDVLLSVIGVPNATGTFCIGGDRPIYNFSITFENDTNRETVPVDLVFTFTDGLSNVNNITIQSISYIVPTKPVVAPWIDSENTPIVYVGIPYFTRDFRKLSTPQIDSYIVEKGRGPTKTDRRTFTGPNKMTSGEKYDTHDNTFIDRDVITNEQTSYRVAFRNIYGEQTQWSEWATVTP